MKLTEINIDEINYDDEGDVLTVINEEYMKVSQLTLNYYNLVKLYRIMCDSRITKRIGMKIYIESLMDWTDVFDQPGKKIFVYFKKIFENKVQLYVNDLLKKRKAEQLRQGQSDRITKAKKEVLAKKKEMVELWKLFKQLKGRFESNFVESQVEQMLVNQQFISARREIEKVLNNEGQK